MRVLGLVIVLTFPTVVDSLKDLRLLGLLPMTGDIYPGGWSCLVPVKMALDGINAHPNLLQGYNLSYDYIDNQVISSL